MIANKPPTLKPIYSTNAPTLLQFPMQQIVFPDTYIQLSGRFIQLYNSVTNKTRMYHLDESYGDIQILQLDHTRRLLLIAFSVGNQMQIHIIHLPTFVKLAQLHVQESSTVCKKFTAVQIQPDYKYVVATVGAPDLVLAAWQLPMSVNEFVTQATKLSTDTNQQNSSKQQQLNQLIKSFNVVNQLKYQHVLKNSKLVTELHFKTMGQNQYVLFQCGAQCFEIQMITENSTRQVAVLNMKHLNGRFAAFSFTERYTYVLAPQQLEVLVLRGELLVSFFPSELMSNRVFSTYKTQFVPLNAVVKESETITTLHCVQDQILLIGTNFGRIHIYHIKQIEGDNLQCQTCKTIGSLAYPVVQCQLLVTQQLRTQSPVQYITANEDDSAIIVQQEDHQTYISSNSFSTTLYNTITSAQNAIKMPIDPKIEQIYDSVLKYKQIITNDQDLKLQDDEFYYMSPMRFQSKLAIQGLKASDPQEIARFRAPENWPQMLFSSMLTTPFLAVQQTLPSTLTTLSKQISYHPLSKNQLGKEFYEASWQITAIAWSDEANMFTLGDAKGTVKLYDLETRLPILMDEFRIPDTIQYKQEVLEDDVDEALLAYQQLKAEEAGEGEKFHIDTFDEEEISRRQYKVTSLALHRSGNYVVVGYSLANKQQLIGNIKFSHIVCIYNVLQGELHLATLIELQTEAIQVVFDSSCNNLYILTQTALQSFTFYELFCHLDIELRRRAKHLDPVIEGYFTPQDRQKQEEFNQKLSAGAVNNAKPVTLRISSDATAAYVSFDDGDLVCFDLTTGEIKRRYIVALPGAKEARYCIDFQILEKTDLDESAYQLDKMVAEATANEQRHVPIIATLTDGQIVELRPSGVARLIAGTGINSANSIVNSLVFLKGQNAVQEDYRVNRIRDKVQNEVLAGILQGQQQKKPESKVQSRQFSQQSSNEENKSIQNIQDVLKNPIHRYLLSAGTNGYIQMFYINQEGKQLDKQQIKIHAAEIKYMCLVRGVWLVSVSTDGQIVISEIKFYVDENGENNSTDGQISRIEDGMQKSVASNLKQKQVPCVPYNAVIHKSIQLRSIKLQECLDLLLFELLNKAFSMFGISQTEVNAQEVINLNETQAMFQEYDNFRQNMLQQLIKQTKDNLDIKRRTQQTKDDNSRKLKIIEAELASTYEEQIHRHRNHLQKLKEQYVLTREKNDNIIQDFNDETAKLLYNEQQKTISEVEQLQKVYNSLIEDQEALKKLQEIELKQQNDEYDRQVNALESELRTASEKQTGAQVSELQKQQKELITEQQKLINSLNQRKENIQSTKNRVANLQEQLYQKKNQLDLNTNNLSNKQQLKQRKQQQILTLQQNKMDLKKLQNLLNNHISDLQEQINPRDQHISDLQTQIKEIDNEILQDINKKQVAELNIKGLMDRKKGMNNTFKEYQEQIQQYETEFMQIMTDLKAFCTDLSLNYFKVNNLKNGATAIKNKYFDQETGERIPVQLDNKIRPYVTAARVMYGKYIRKDMAADLQGKLTGLEGTFTLQDQLQRILNTANIKLIQPRNMESGGTSLAHQREYLEKSVKTLEKSLERRRQQLNQAIEKARQQSGTLLGFSNLMRRENKELQQKVRDAKFQLAKKKQDLKNISENLFGAILKAAGTDESSIAGLDNMENKGEGISPSGTVVGIDSTSGVTDQFKGRNLESVLENEFYIEGDKIPFIGEETVQSGSYNDIKLEVPEALPQIKK